MNLCILFLFLVLAFVFVVLVFFDDGLLFLSSFLLSCFALNHSSSFVFALHLVFLLLFLCLLFWHYVIFYFWLPINKHL